MKKECKASVTVFAALMLMLVAQFMFTLLEGARIKELGKIATMQSDSQIESVMSKYCNPLVDNYNILTFDMGNADGKLDLEETTSLLEEISARNNAYEGGTALKKYTNLLRLDLAETDYSEYTLITDCNGKVYESLVASYMKETLPMQVVDELYDNYLEADKINRENKYSDSKIDDAKKALENAKTDGESPKCRTVNSKINFNKTSKKINSDETSSTSTEKTEDKKISQENLNNDDTFDSVKESQAKGVLSLVLPKGAKVSENTLSDKNRVSKRTLNKGLNPKTPETEVYNKVLYQQYLSKYMSCYSEKNSNHLLKYELEYILCGKTKDSDNLKDTVTRLLAIREAANMAYIYTDAKKVAEASALATTIAGASVNPVVIEAVKTGLIASWAYCESILDVRALLSGDKIPLMKTQLTWTSDLKAISSILSGTAKAKSCETGMDYKNYLGTLILLESIEKSAYRAMDLQEATIRNTKGYENFKMDNCACSITINSDYQYHYLFLNFVSMVEHGREANHIKRASSYSYITKPPE